MKRKGLYIILAISITCTMFTACKKNDSVESANVVEEKTDIMESESVTEEIETTISEEVESTVEAVESTEEAETVTAVEGEKEVLTGEEISLDLEEESTEETDKDKALLEAMKEGINEGISPLAGTTSKHGYVYPDDYVECGPKDEDAIADVERMFDNGWLTEEEYQRDLEFFKNPDAIQDIVDSLGAVSESERAGNTGNPPATGGAPIELPVLPETVPDGRICY